MVEKLPDIYPREEQIVFNCLIGEAISQWAGIEYGLALIAGASLGSINASTALFKIENFRSKIAFVRMAFELSLVGSLHKVEAATTFAFVESLSGKRNDIAHARTTIFSASPPGRQMAIVPLFPTINDRDNPNLPPSGSYCLIELDLARQQFRKASSMLKSLHSRIVGETDLFAEPAQREPLRQTPAQLRRHYLEELPQRVRSSRE